MGVARIVVATGGEMNVLLENYLDHVSAHTLYDHLRAELLRRGHGAQLGSSAYMSEAALREHDVLISNKTVPPPIRRLLRSYGGNGWSRPETLVFLREQGVDTMTWSLAADRRAVLDLFDRWDVERILLKRSGTMKAMGLATFTRDGVDRLEWDPGKDVFCQEVNPDDGDLYKAELFNGKMIISWIARQAPLLAYFDGPYMEGVRGGEPDRDLFEFPPGIEAVLKHASCAATRGGVGYAAIDMMRAPDGRLQAIEMNIELVATWWTAQFPFVKERYAAALLDLLSARDEWTASSEARLTHG